MSVRIGVIGAGAMGADHVHTFATTVPQAQVSYVYDADSERARNVAGPVGAMTAISAEDLIASADVDAVVVASPDYTHAGLAKACIDAGKPVLCEKPLAPTSDESWTVVQAELAAGRRLVQVGFMRRFDPGYLALRRAIQVGEVGEPRIVHCTHRNATAHPTATSDGIVSNSMIHELDLLRWLLSDEVVGIEIRSPVVDGFRDPQLATIEMSSGVLVSVEVFVNAGYGYDVSCEIVGTHGTASLVPPAEIVLRRTGAAARPISDDFIARFRHAYNAELAAWTTTVLHGSPAGPSAWDGHLASTIAEAGVHALHTGGRVAVPALDRPSLYD